jgi:hypothetical protein
MIIVAVTIVFTYIKPTFANIEKTRATTDTYIAEADKVKGVDDLLIQTAAKVDAVSAADSAALKRYVPDAVDDVAVMKDIQGIFAALALPLGSLTAGGEGTAPGAISGTISNVALVPHTFTVSSKMTYDELKTLLKVLEVNNYLLQIDSLSLIPDESGLLTVSMVLSTFNRTVITPVEAEGTTDESENI